MVTDVSATGVTHQRQPMELIRDRLTADGILTAAELRGVPDGTRVRIAGVVTHRQRPQTASGLTFLGMEDETGLMNIVVSKGCWARYRSVARDSPALLVRGRLESAEGVVNVVAEEMTPLPVPASSRSRDFH